MLGVVRNEDLAVALEQGNAHQVGQHFQRGVALDESPAAAIARRNGGLADALPGAPAAFPQRRFFTRAGFFIRQQMRMTTANPEHTRRVGFDPQNANRRPYRSRFG